MGGILVCHLRLVLAQVNVTVDNLEGNVAKTLSHMVNYTITEEASKCLLRVLKTF